MGNYESVNKKVSTETVENFDPERYQGMWYEQARFDNLPFEKGCLYATADYKWNTKARTLAVLNTCYPDRPQKTTDVKGVAVQTQDSGKLLVDFGFGPPAPYWVHYTDYCNYAVVGNPSGLFLWILSRRRRVNLKDRLGLITRVDHLGYDSSQLLWSSFPRDSIGSEKITDSKNLKPGYVGKWRRNKDERVLQVEFGLLTVKISTLTFRVSEGEVFNIQAGLAYRLSNTGSDKLVRYGYVKPE